MVTEDNITITPKWVGYNYFCLTTGLSRAKVEVYVRKGKVIYAKDGKNTLLNLWRYYQDLEGGKFEL